MSLGCLSDQLQAYWAGQLTDSECRAVLAHIQDCAACRTAWEESGTMADLLVYRDRRMPVSRVPSWRRLRGRLGLPAAPRWSRPRVPLIGVATALLVLVMGALLYPHATPRPADRLVALTRVARLTTPTGQTKGWADWAAGRLAVTVHHLAPVRAGYVYEVWVYGSTGAKAIGALAMTGETGHLDAAVSGPAGRSVVICRATTQTAQRWPGPLVLSGTMRRV